MQLCLYLTPELIVCPLRGTSKEEIIRELALHLAVHKGIADAEGLFTAAMEREHTGSTFLPSGVAIPHARVADMNDIAVVMGIAPQPVHDENGTSALTAQIFCLFFSPTDDKEFGRHLKLLARISAIFCDTDFIEHIGSLANPRAVFEALQKRERTLDEE